MWSEVTHIGMGHADMWINSQSFSISFGGFHMGHPGLGQQVQSLQSFKAFREFETTGIDIQWLQGPEEKIRLG